MGKRMVLGGVLGAALLMAAAARSGAPVVEPVTATAPAAARPLPQPAAIAVPAALRARFPAIEMSGIVWAPTLDRYLVVIDDAIDLDEHERHAPFVLALDRNGTLDVDPVMITGVEEVDDAEAIVAGSGNTFYLLTSHSPNKKGKIAKSRRQLLELALVGRKLEVRNALDLLHGKGDIANLLEKLGFPADTAVDLEGLAFHAGSLYVGLKAPLLPDDSAAVFRLERPAEAFARGKLAKGDLALWGQAKLAVPGAAGAPVPQGVADLFFAADGALYLCANAPKGRAKDGGGALWRIAKPAGGRMEPTLVRQFSQLKPEGVTVAPGGGALTVVFDRDRRDPLWLRWPIAR